VMSNRNLVDFTDAIEIQWSQKEKINYDYDTLACKKEPCGHYTQVVWATNRLVGCAYYQCNGLKGLDPQKFAKAGYLVYDYLPPGNFGGVKPFKKGPACSHCASGAGWCKDGLCIEARSAKGKGCSCEVRCYTAQSWTKRIAAASALTDGQASTAKRLVKTVISNAVPTLAGRAVGVEMKHIPRW